MQLEVQTGTGDGTRSAKAKMDKTLMLMPEVQVEIKGGAGEAKAGAPLKEKKYPAAEKAIAPGTRRIVRIAATDIDGALPTGAALRRVRGISFMFANAICRSTGIDGKRAIGSLTDKELEMLQTFISNQATAPVVPKWMLNRRKDPESGADGHIVGTTLTFRQREDINFMKRIRCRRGIRHELGLPVRGQRTRSTGRKGRGVGVMRKAAAAAPAATPKTASAKPAEKSSSLAK